MAPDLGRRLLAEAIGTVLLVFFGAGAVVAALGLGNVELDHAGLGIIAISFLTTSIFGDSPPWEDYWIYVVGPLAGGAVAALLYDFVARPERVEAPTAAPAAQGAAGTVEGRRVAPARMSPSARATRRPRTGRLQGTGGDIEGKRD
jgi:glycerol uptake facilitator-like aquaporin